LDKYKKSIYKALSADAMGPHKDRRGRPWSRISPSSFFCLLFRTTISDNPALGQISAQPPRKEKANTMTNVADKFGDWIKEGFDLYKNNLGLLILSSLIAFLLSGVTLGILSGPMYAGLIGIVLRLRDGDPTPPVVGDVFQGFQFFLPSFLFGIVWGAIMVAGCLILVIIPCLGQLLSVCLVVAASAFLMFGLFLIVDRKMDFWPASMASIEKVKPTFFPYLGLAVVAGVIGQIGALACGIGACITMPIYFAIIAEAYRDVFGNGAAAPAREARPPAPPEAPVEPTVSRQPDESGDAKEE
jgi:hypothetical protein